MFIIAVELLFVIFKFFYCLDVGQKIKLFIDPVDWFSVKKRRRISIYFDFHSFPHHIAELI